RGDTLKRLAVLQSFEVRKKEEAVANHPPAEREAVLIAMEGGLIGRSLAPLPGVELVIAQEFEDCAVVIVGTGFRGDIDLPGIASELGRVDPALYFEFLERVHRRPEHERIPVGICILNAIERVVVELHPLARDGEVLRGALSAEPSDRGA